MNKPLELQHVVDPDRAFERELERIVEPRLAKDADDPVWHARRAALAAIIERAHAAWRKRNTKAGSR
jgi:hypothetical protein